MKIKFQNSLIFRLTALFVILAVSILVITISIAGFSFRRGLDRYVMQSPVAVAESVARELSPYLISDASVKELSEKLDSLAEKYGAQIVIYDRTGKPVLTSGTNRTTCDVPWCEGPMGGAGARTVAVPIVDRGRVVGFVGVILNRETSIIGTINRFRTSVYVSLITAGALVFILAAALSFFLSRVIARPLEEAAEAAAAISDGRYDKRIETIDNSEIGVLQKTLNLLAEKLKTIEERRIQMASDIAHEFKTPLTVLRANLEAMADGVIEATPERLHQLSEEINRLDSLVEQLKTIHDLDGKQITMDIQPVNLSEFISKMIEIYGPLAESSELTVDQELKEVIVKADRHLLQRIFENLFSNSVTYTDARGKIIVRTYKEEPYGCFEIEDTGIGIKEEEIPLVFERFYRSESSRSRKTGGSGLGLSIVKKLVEVQNGKVSLQSSPGKGTKVKVCLPIS